MTEDAKKPLGRILVRQHAITQPELDRALLTATPGGPPLASRMIESGALSEIAALKALSEQSGVPGIDLNQVCVKLRDLEIIPREVAIRHKLLPVLVREDRVFVAMAAPGEKKVIDELEFVTGKRVFPYVALAGPLMRAINTAYELRDRGEAFYVGPQCPPEIQRKAGHDPGRDGGSAPKPPDDGSPASEGRHGNLPPAPVARAVVARVQPPPLPRRPGAAPVKPVIVDSPALDEGPVRKSDPDAGFRPAAPAGTAGAGTSRAPAPSSHVIVDDAMGRMTGADELTDADFGALGRELSVVGDLPRAPVPKGPSDGKRTVLVVDDEADIRKLVRRVLEDRGFRVTEAGRGHEALAMLKESPPDLVVLDAMLPEVHGFDIAKRMKGTERYGHIPIVMISAVYRGWRFAEDVRQSYGVDAYLEKPFKMSELVAAVETALSHRPAPSSVENISADAEKKLSQGIEAYQKGDIATAIEHLREGTHIDPLAYRLHFHLGLLYGKQGRVYDAIQELQTALDINGNHFPALKNLAVLYQKAGFRNKAIEAWERALRVAPDDPTRQSIKEHLVGLL
jgi:DNA-binding response OmpR family regulator